MPIEKYEIRNRWTGAVQITAEITCTPDALPSVKLGLAVKWAVANRASLVRARLDCANLDGASLDDADLEGASLVHASLVRASLVRARLVRADLYGASLDDADLEGARLDDADLDGASLVRARLVNANLDGATGVTDHSLRAIKADMWTTLAHSPGEVDGLIAALEQGRVNGSQYQGDCACLVGTLANVAGVNYDTLPHDSSALAEVWFAAIREGDKPGDASAGGIASEWALKWAKEFKSLCAPRVPELSV